MMNIYISENPNPNRILQNSFLKTVFTLFNQTYFEERKIENKNCFENNKNKEWKQKKCLTKQMQA